MAGQKVERATSKNQGAQLSIETKIVTEIPLLTTTSFTVLSAKDIDAAHIDNAIAQLNRNAVGGFFAASQNGEQVLIKFIQRFVICGTTNIPSVAKRASCDGVMRVRGAVYSLLNERREK